MGNLLDFEIQIVSETSDRDWNALFDSFSSGAFSLVEQSARQLTLESSNGQSFELFGDFGSTNGSVDRMVFNVNGERDVRFNLSETLDVLVGDEVLSEVFTTVTSTYVICLFGGQQRDVFDGGALGDMLFGGGARDILKGLGGNDMIKGQGGNDRIEGGAGKDDIEGGGGRDTIKGQGGSDILKGGSGNDKVIGGGGKDIVAGETGNDTLKSGGGNDVVIGGAGRDKMKLGGGDDLAIMEAGDRAVGGAGSDTFLFMASGWTGSKESGPTTIEGGDAGDRVVIWTDDARAVITALGERSLADTQAGNLRVEELDLTITGVRDISVNSPSTDLTFSQALVSLRPPEEELTEMVWNMGISEYFSDTPMA